MLKLVMFAFVALCLLPLICLAEPAESGTVVLDPAVLAAHRTALASGDARLKPAYDTLLAQAERALAVAPVSVTEKTELPASGDVHDYYSTALYAWPNPNTADGLPFIRKDGEVSPVAYAIPDKQNKGTMLGTVETLSLAYYFSGDERFSEHAALMLRAWFIDPATRMNPNLNHAQAWPGLNDGRQYGIIDFAGFSLLPDWLSLLAGSPHWSTEDDAAMRAWLADYLFWLRESRFGSSIRDSHNNHGCWYDTQVVAIALYLGENELARQVLEEAKEKRIAGHIMPDGRMPLELARTKSWEYSVYNLKAIVRLAQLGERAGVDLWNYRSEDGRSINAALDYLLPYAYSPETWPHKQIYEIKLGGYLGLLRHALAGMGDTEWRGNYEQAVAELGGALSETHRELLTHS